jgi:hypothetical protein
MSVIPATQGGDRRIVVQRPYLKNKLKAKGVGAWLNRQSIV